MNKKINNGFLFTKRLIGVTILMLLILIQFYAILRLTQGLVQPNEYSEIFLNLGNNGIKKLFIEVIVIYFSLLVIDNFDNIENNRKINWDLWILALTPNILLYMTFIHTSIGSKLNATIFSLIGLLIAVQLIHKLIKKNVLNKKFHIQKHRLMKQKYNTIKI